MKKWTAAIAIVLVLLIGIGWAFMGDSQYSSNPNVAELQKKFDDSAGRPDDLTKEQRQEFRGKIRELPEDQRREFFESRRDHMMQFVQQRMDQFFSRSPEEQQERLDEMIDRMESRRQARDQNGQKGGRPEISPQQRDARRKRMLDNTSPELRAGFNKFKGMLNQRREERGLEPIQGPPRGMFGPPRGGR